VLDGANRLISTDPVGSNSTITYDARGNTTLLAGETLVHATTLQPAIEMGAHPYISVLGRFLRLDPIPGGAAKRDCAYVNDPSTERISSGAMERRG
jgi:hypothetical protein